MTNMELDILISSNAIPHVLILYGNEPYFMPLYIDRICNALGANKRICNSFSLFRNILGYESFIEEKTLYVVYDDEAFEKDVSAWNDLDNCSSKTFVIFCYNKVFQSNSSLLSRFSNCAVELNHLSDAVISKHLKYDFGLDPYEIDIMFRLAGNEWGVMTEILDVCEHFDIGQSVGMNLRKLYDDNVVVPLRQDFKDACMDSILKRNSTNFVYYFNLAKESIPLALFSYSLYNMVRGVMLLKICDSPNYEKITGLPYAMVQKCYPYIKGSNTKALVTLVQKIGELDNAIKISPDGYSILGSLIFDFLEV